jgi:hypothetical protein
MVDMMLPEANYESERYREWVKNTSDPSIIMPKVQWVIDGV